MTLTHANNLSPSWSWSCSCLSLQYAVKAGLGEYGRHGLVITPRFGPRVRFGKIFTNMPLSHDVPIDFGVQKFCENCDLCATGCPAKAISFSPPGGAQAVEEVHNKSNLTGSVSQLCHHHF